MLNREPRRRWLELRTGLFFLAALVWFAGVVFEISALRWAAIGVALVALVLGLMARRSVGRPPSADTEG